MISFCCLMTITFSWGAGLQIGLIDWTPNTLTYFTSQLYDCTYLPSIYDLTECKPAKWHFVECIITHSVIKHFSEILFYPCINAVYNEKKLHRTEAWELWLRKLDMPYISGAFSYIWLPQWIVSSPSEW